MDQNFEVFANSNIAIMVGFAIACCSTAIVRSVGAESSARRLMRAGERDIAAAARGSRQSISNGLAYRMVDRHGLIAPCLSKISPDAAFPTANILRDVRAALNLTELKRHAAEMPRDHQTALQEVLEAISDRYRRNEPDQNVDLRLVAKMDALIEKISGVENPDLSDIVRLALVGLRLNVSTDCSEEASLNEPASKPTSAT